MVRDVAVTRTLMKSFRNKILFHWPLWHKKLLLAKTKFMYWLWKRYQVFWPEFVSCIFNTDVSLKEGFKVIKDELYFSEYFIFLSHHQLKAHWEWLTQPFTENGYTHFRRFDILSHHFLQDALRMSKNC